MSWKSLKGIDTNIIKLSDLANPDPIPPTCSDSQPPLLKQELEAYTNVETIRNLKNAKQISQAELVECQCCFGDFPLFYKTTHCESFHHFCLECASKGLMMEMNRVESIAAFKCASMKDGCDAVFSDREIRRFLLPDAYERMSPS